MQINFTYIYLDYKVPKPYVYETKFKVALKSCKVEKI